jgi:hypothetical protein
VTNALAYYDKVQRTATKSFITLATGWKKHFFNRLEFFLHQNMFFLKERTYVSNDEQLVAAGP